MSKSIMQMIKNNADAARHATHNFSGFISNENLKEQTIQHFCAFSLSYIENDDQIRRAVDEVEGACEALSIALRDITNRDAAGPLRERLIEKIDELERIMLRVGVANGRAEALLNDVRRGERIAG